MGPENAGSLTPFEMTFFKNDPAYKEFKLYHYAILAILQIWLRLLVP
jgi:hypothetical protein